jgi:DnaJ family protein A protein 5
MNNSNEKKENKKKNNNPNININPILFTKKYPKKENNKFPLRINYTSEKINNALENESLMDNNDEKENNKKEKISYLSKRSSKNIDKKDIFNSFNKGNNLQIKNMNKIENNKADKKIEKSKNNGQEKNKNKDLEKNKNKDLEKNKNKDLEKNKTKDLEKNKKKDLEKNKTRDLEKNISKKYCYNTERINHNEINRNKSLSKTKKNILIQKNYNLFFSGDKNEINNLNNSERNQDKKEYNASNKIKKNIYYNYTMNHNSLSFNPVKKEKKSNHILTIKNNDRIMLSNNGGLNKNNSMENNDAPEKKRDRVYKISSHVVNEQFYKKNFLEEEINSSDDENILQMSMQSLNDSKIMEIANRYITDDENLDKNEVIEILNSKKEKN